MLFITVYCDYFTRTLLVLHSNYSYLEISNWIEAEEQRGLRHCLNDNSVKILLKILLKIL